MWLARKTCLNVNSIGVSKVIARLIDWGFETDMKGVRLRVSIQTIRVIEI